MPAVQQTALHSPWHRSGRPTDVGRRTRAPADRVDPDRAGIGYTITSGRRL